MDTIGTVAVDCLHSETCKGEIEITLSRTDHINPDGSTFPTFEGERQSQTCTCHYDDEEVESLVHRAREKLGVI